MITVYIPPNLSSKEMKKFRKDTRRKIQRDHNINIDDITIEFLPQEIKEVEQSKKSYPRINELLAEQNKVETTKLKKNKNLNSVLSMSDKDKSKYIAMDCEMVGIGTTGNKSALARVSIVDFNNHVLLDSHVQVPVKVTNYRTHISGIKPSDIHSKNPNALPLDTIRNKVCDILEGKILVGHALHNDLKALTIPHPGKDIRDTARFLPYKKNVNGKHIARKLKDLAQMELGMIIQEDGFAHDSIQDAIAAMELYKARRYEWEKDIESRKRRVRK